MRAIDPNSGAVLRKNAAAIAAGIVLVMLIIALGWALSKARWKTAEIVSARGVEESTEPDQVERVVDQGERILAARRSQQFDSRVGDGGGYGIGDSSVHQDPESERLLQESLRRMEEERCRSDDLAREADLSPLGQGLHQLGERSGTHGPGNGFQLEEASQVPGIDTRLSSLPNSISEHGFAASGDRAVPSTVDPPAVALNVGRFTIDQRAMDPEVPGNDRDRLNDAHRLFAGTVIPSVLLTNIDSGLPGTVRAQVTSDVRDSATGIHVLIPRGSFLSGRYDEAQDVHTNRLFIGWDRVQFPNGVSVSPGNAVTSDLSGVAGIKPASKG